MQLTPTGHVWWTPDCDIARHMNTRDMDSFRRRQPRNCRRNRWMEAECFVYNAVEMVQILEFGGFYFSRRVDVRADFVAQLVCLLGIFCKMVEEVR